MVKKPFYRQTSAGLTAAFLALGLLAGCGSGGGDVAPEDISAKSSAESIGKAYASEMSTIADALEGIQTQEDADRAIDAIQAARDNLEKMTDALDGDLSPMKMAQIMKSGGSEIMQVQQRISGSMMQLAQSNPELLNRITSEMKTLPGPN